MCGQTKTARRQNNGAASRTTISNPKKRIFSPDIRALSRSISPDKISRAGRKQPDAILRRQSCRHGRWREKQAGKRHATTKTSALPARSHNHNTIRQTARTERLQDESRLKTDLFNPVQTKPLINGGIHSPDPLTPIYSCIPGFNTPV